MKKMMKKPTRFILLCSSAFVLVACSGNGISYDHTAGIDAGGPARHGQGYTLVDNTNPDDAFVQMPSRIMRGISMDERVYANGIAQTLTLGADAAVRGANHIKINLVSRASFTDMTEKLSIHGTEAHELRSQFKATFPGKRFVMDQSLHSNEYGNFGFSFFEAGNSIGCMYGWQSMEAASTKNTTRLVKNWLRDRTASANNAKLSYRVRFCGRDLKYSDAIYIMRSMRLNVPADVFVRDRNLRWSSGGNYTGVGYRGANAQDLEYITGEPYSERRDTLCEPGSTIGDYNAYGSTCAAKPKPAPVATPRRVVRRQVAPVTKPVVAPTPAKPETQVTTVVPLPAPGAPQTPVAPQVQPRSPSILDVPTIRAVPGSSDQVSQGNGVVLPSQRGDVPLPPQSAQQPAIMPIQPAQAPRIIPMVPQQQVLPQVQAQQVQIQAAQQVQNVDTNGNPMIPLPR